MPIGNFHNNKLNKIFMTVSKKINIVQKIVSSYSNEDKLIVKTFILSFKTKYSFTFYGDPYD